MIELIDVSSYNIGELSTNAHDWQAELRKNADHNLKKITHHNPNIIFQTGISQHYLAETMSAFSLKHVKDLTHGNPSRLAAKVFELTLGNRIIPWIAVRHISQNFSSNDRDLVHAYVDEQHAKAGVTRF